MRRIFQALILLMSTALLPMLADAKPEVMPTAGNPCFNETATLTINFNSMETEVSGLKTKFDTKIEDIQKTAKDAGAEQIDIQSMSYNVSTQTSNLGAQFNFSGNASFKLLPATKAVDILSALIKKGHMASLNVSKYNSGRCPVTPPTAGQNQ